MYIMKTTNAHTLIYATRPVIQGQGPALNPTYDRCLYTQVKLPTTYQESTFSN